MINGQKNYGKVLKQGDLVFVPFPYSDFSKFKKRPVIIISKTKDNIRKGDCLTVPLTSNLKPRKYSFEILEKDYKIKI